MKETDMSRSTNHFLVSIYDFHALHKETPQTAKQMHIGTCVAKCKILSKWQSRRNSVTL